MGASAKLPHLTKSVIKRSADEGGTTMINWLTYLKHRITYSFFLKIYGLFSLFFTKSRPLTRRSPPISPKYIGGSTSSDVTSHVLLQLGVCGAKIPAPRFFNWLAAVEHVAPRASPETGSTQQILFGVAICEIKKATRLEIF